jgi:hypothetical protein
LLLPHGSAATMVMLGLMHLAARVMPDSMPPPLTGTTLQQCQGGKQHNSSTWPDWEAKCALLQQDMSPN